MSIKRMNLSKLIDIDLRNLSHRINKYSMKKFIYVFAILFTFCSCAKDYPRQVKDRVEQYQKDGKIVLSHSDDPTGKEHYVVFADVKAQVIGVDTLGEVVRKIHIGSKPMLELEIQTDENRGLRPIFKSADYERICFLDSKGKMNVKYRSGEVQSFNMRVYKDKYIIFEKAYCGMFLNDGGAYYNLSEGDMGENGNINVVMHKMLQSIIPEEWNDYTYYNPNLSIDRDHDDFLYKVTISPDRKFIKQAKSVFSNGIEIPTEMFSSWSSLRPYLIKIVQIQNEEKRSSGYYDE